VFWFSLQLLFQTFLILRRTERDAITEVHRSSYKVPVILVAFNETLIFSTDFRNVRKYQISWKSVQCEPSCFMRSDAQADGRTDMMKLILGFRNFSNSLRNDITDVIYTTRVYSLCLPYAYTFIEKVKQFLIGLQSRNLLFRWKEQLSSLRSVTDQVQYNRTWPKIAVPVTNSLFRGRC